MQVRARANLRMVCPAKLSSANRCEPGRGNYQEAGSRHPVHQEFRIGIVRQD